MSLRLQLLAVGLLTLVLPWTGFRYVQEMETALRAGLEQSLLASAATVAAALEEQERGAVHAAGLRRAARGRHDLCDGARAGARARRRSRRPLEHDGGNRASPSAAGHRRLGRHLRAVRSTCSSASRTAISSTSANPGSRRTATASCSRPDPGAARWWLLNTAAPGAFRAQETGPDRFEPSEIYDGARHRRVAGDAPAVMRSRCACR